MLKEQAINLLTQVKEIILGSESWLDSTHQPIEEAFSMAIKALVQPEGINYVKFSEEDYEKIAEQLRKIPIVLTLSEPEIIRCKDCKNYGGGTYCHERDGMWDENDFCSYAERKENG